VLTRSPGGSPAVRRRWATGTLGVLALGLLTPVAACGNGCTTTALEVRPLTVQNLTAPVTLTARLTHDGQPFPDAPVKLALTVEGRDGYHGEELFQARTGPDGVATVTRPGLAGATLPSNHVTGLAAYFQPLNDTDGKPYCWSSATAPVTCVIAGSSGACPSRDPLG
jgi:hypothetical protein